MNCFEFTPVDLFCLITEIDSEEMEPHRKEIRGRFKVLGEGATIFDFFALKRDFVEKWHRGEYKVTYRDVSLKLFATKRGHL